VRSVEMKLKMTLCVWSLAIGGIANGANLATPADGANIGIPNAAVATSSNGLNLATTYRVDLEMKLTAGGTLFNIGSTNTFSGVAVHNENIDVTYNPGPGNYGGNAKLMKYNGIGGGGSWQQAKANGVTWIGPNMGP